MKPSDGAALPGSVSVDPSLTIMGAAVDYAELARRFDAQDRPLEAIWAYEVSLGSGGADLDLYLDLAVLYMVCSDFGYAPYHRLMTEFVHACPQRALEVLAEGEARFGSAVEVETWRAYVREFVLFEDAPDGVYEELAARGESALPGCMLYLRSGGRVNIDDTRVVYDEVRAGRTARQRLLKGLLESSVLPRQE